MYAAELRPRAKPGYVHSLSCDPVKFSQDLGRANLTLASTQNRRLFASKPTSELPVPESSTVKKAGGRVFLSVQFIADVVESSTKTIRVTCLFGCKMAEVSGMLCLLQRFRQQFRAHACHKVSESNVSMTNGSCRRYMYQGFVWQ